MRKKEEIFKVPEGYFSSLEMRLSAIPTREQAKREREGSAFRRFAPFGVLVAACVALALVLSANFNMRKSYEAESVYELYYVADLIPLTDPDMIFDDTEVADSCSTEDIVDYLIWSDTSLAMIEQVIK